MRTVSSTLWMATTLASAALACIGLGGCEPSTHELAIDLRVDLAPGIEFDQVSVSLDGGDPIVVDVTSARDFERHPRVAEFRAVSDGRHEYAVTVSLGGGTVAGTKHSIVLHEALLSRAYITRSCAFVMCPAGDPRLTACYGGVCVDPTCDPDLAEAERDDAGVADAGDLDTDAGAPPVADAGDLDTDADVLETDAGSLDESCGPGSCARTSECTAAHDPPTCVTPLCQRGACLYLPDNSRCGVDQYCDPETDTCADFVGPPVVRATATSSTSITVDWDPVSGAEAYVVELAPSAAFDTGVASFTLEDASSREQRFTDLPQGRTGHARVRAIVGGVMGTWGTTSALTPIDTPRPPTVTLTYDGSSRSVAEGKWVHVQSTIPSERYFFFHVGSAVSCPDGTRGQFRYQARYTGEVYGWTDWWTPEDVIVEDVLEGYTLTLAAIARCVSAETQSGPSGEGSACRGWRGARC